VFKTHTKNFDHKRGSKANKKHSDSLNCLLNCTEFRVTLYISQKPLNGKNGIFYVEKGDKFHPLFFYDIPSNKGKSPESTKKITNVINATRNMKSELESIGIDVDTEESEDDEFYQITIKVKKD